MSDNKYLPEHEYDKIKVYLYLFTSASILVLIGLLRIYYLVSASLQLSNTEHIIFISLIIFLMISAFAGINLIREKMKFVVLFMAILIINILLSMGSLIYLYNDASGWHIAQLLPLLPLIFSAFGILPAKQLLKIRYDETNDKK